MVFTLPDLIKLEKGEIVVHRVIDAQGPRIETSLSSSGTYKKMAISDMATYWFIPRSNGVLCGQGRGVVIRQDDGKGEMATWTGLGVAKFTGSAKKMTITGSLLYHTDSTGDLKELDNLMAVFKYDVAENGKSVGNIWELKLDG
jgi:hypothetical protein